MTRACSHCNCDFVASRTFRKYCSVACSVEGGKTACRRSAARWRENNPDTHIRYSRQWTLDHPEQTKRAKENYQKRLDRVRHDREAMALSTHEEGVLFFDDVSVTAESIIRDLQLEGDTSLYIGLTKCQDAKHEAFQRICGTPSTSYTGRARGGRPAFSWANGAHITMRCAMRDLKFSVTPVYESGLRFNAAAVEKELQRRLSYLDFGRRLWRKNGYREWNVDRNRSGSHKVYIARSESLLSSIRDGKVVLYI